MAQVRRVTIDEKFNAEYAKKGLQPSVSTDGRIRNVRMERRETANDSYYGSAESTKSPNQPDNFAQNQAQTPRQPRRLTPQPGVSKKKTSTATKMKARAKATAINTGVLSWVIPLYVIFQIPFALLNLAFFGLAYVYLGIFGFGETERVFADRQEDGGFITGIVFEGIRRIVGALNEVIASLTGFNLGDFFANFNPANIYTATLGILFAYAVLLLLSVGLLYLLAGLKPLSGRGSGFKITAFIACLIGYTLPILNLLPWVLLWTTAVWKNPK
jgi:hypothetical protein